MPTLVMWSLALLPLSVVSATPGAAVLVSRVKVRLPAAEMLPATSVWRTSTCWRPAPAGQRRGAGAPVAAAVERVLDRRPALHARQRQRRIVGDLVAPRGARVVGKRHARRGRVDRIEGEGEGGRGRDVAGDVGLAHLDGVGPLHQLGEGRGAGAPVAAAVDRVLDRRPALHARQRQRRIVGDLVAARGARVVGKRHARRRRRCDIDRDAQGVESALVPLLSVAVAVRE